MKGYIVNDRKLTPIDAAVKEAQKKIADATKESLLILAEKACEREVEALQTGLDLQIKNFPLAETELRTVTRPWIDKAKLVLTTLRETGLAPTAHMDEVIDKIKQRSWEQWVAIGNAYPELDITSIHDEECARYDVMLAQHNQDLAIQEADHLSRMSAVREATLEGVLGEITLDEYVRKVTDQL